MGGGRPGWGSTGGGEAIPGSLGGVTYVACLARHLQGKFYARSGIPEYLRLAIKPLVDAVMRGDDPIQSELTFGRHTPGLESMSIGDVNYVTGCALDPLTCLL